jgi:hypothetical protein
MIAREKVAEMVRSQLTLATEEEIDRLTDDVVRDAEHKLYSLIREAVAKARETALAKMKNK